MKKYLFLLLLTTACVPMKNSSISPIQDKGKKIGTANVSVISKYNEGTTMTVTMSDGEIFKGEVVRDSVESEYTDEMLDFSGSGTRYYSKGYAMLIGTNGNSMECMLRMTKPSKSIAWGGGGQCKVSDGRVIPVTLSSANRS